MEKPFIKYLLITNEFIEGKTINAEGNLVRDPQLDRLEYKVESRAAAYSTRLPELTEEEQEWIKQRLLDDINHMYYGIPIDLVREIKEMAYDLDRGHPILHKIDQLYEWLTKTEE